MSRLKGKLLAEELSMSEPVGKVPYIKWLNKTEEYGIYVPDMYEYKYNGNLVFIKVRISEVDLSRMLKADDYVNKGIFFELADEKADLDDDTYLGISYVQWFYYLSKHVLIVAKRNSRKFGYPQKYFLKRRVPRGGRPIGAKNKVSEEEMKRIEEVYTIREQIKVNCYRHDWAEEYVSLMKDIAAYRKKPFIGRKKALQNFTAERRKWLKTNEE